MSEPTDEEIQAFLEMEAAGQRWEWLFTVLNAPTRREAKRMIQERLEREIYPPMLRMLQATDEAVTALKGFADAWNVSPTETPHSL